MRLAARIGSAALGLEWPVAIRAGIKIPGGDFPVDARLLPLSEGQTDLEVSIGAASSPVRSTTLSTRCSILRVLSSACR